MKTLILYILFLLTLIFAEIAIAETLILPTRPAGSGWRVVDSGNYDLPDDYTPPQYDWQKVPKTAEEIKTEIQVRNWKIRQNRIIQTANKTMDLDRRLSARRINYAGKHGSYGRGKLYKIEPIVKWKWIQVKKG